MKKLQILLLTLLFSWITSPVFSATNVYYPANQILRSPLFQCLVNTPSTPPSGMDKLYCKTADGKFYKLTSAGVETEIGSGGSDVANDAIFDASGDLVQGTGANTSAKLTKGAEGTLLRAGATLNAYTSSTFADTYAKGTFLYAATANTIASLAHPGAANYFLYTNATDTAAWLSGANLTSLAGLTFADASIVQLTGVGTSAVLTSGGNNYFLKSSTDNSALMFATPAEVKAALGYITAASEIHVDDILTALGIASEATHFGAFTGSTIADNQTAKAAIQALETSLELKANAANSALTGSGTAETLTITKQIFAAPTELTLSANTDGSITTAQALHTVDTFNDQATGALDTITAGSDGQQLYLRAAHTDRTVILDETGNITIPLGSLISLTDTGTWVHLVYDGGTSKWVVVGTIPDSLNISALDMTAATSSVPWPVNTTAAANTVEGSAYWESDLDKLRIGDGTTGIELDFTANTVITFPSVTATLVGQATSDTFTNKTLDVDGTGNVVKSWGYIVLTHPHLCAAGAPMQTTNTANTFGQCKFGNATDKATNYAEYYLVVPPDIDTDVDLVGTFKIKLGGADTGDHEYEISFDSVADSAAYAGSLGDAVSLAFTADASGADADVETAGPTTLTGWKAAMTAAQLFVIRVARDGDHANDGSTVDSYSGPLVIKYKITQ